MSSKKFGHVNIPFKRIHLELTNVCDFNCVFCPKQFMKRPYGYMPRELALRTMQEIREQQLAEKVTFHVMGEPTLHPDFFQILAHAADIGLPVGLTTNAGGLGSVVGEKLLAFRLHQVDLSLQTPSRESFGIRKAAALSFEQYLDGALTFFSRYRKRYPQTIFKFRFLNTTFPCRSMEHKVGPVRVMSSTAELRRVFAFWVSRIYELTAERRADREAALQKINTLQAWKWNVVEILPNVFFETYLLGDWGHAFYGGPVKKAWAGYCFGMRDHFAVLHNGDVTLCCIDYDGRTAVGNLHQSSLTDILGGEVLRPIMEGFRKFQLVHPYCQYCLGGKTTTAWLTKPLMTIAGMNILKPVFYKTTRLYTA